MRAGPGRRIPSQAVGLGRRIPSQAVGRVAVGLLIALYVAIAYRRAWVCDDAYITFRTIENFFDGLGLTWNPGERVQAYTNGLWMLVMLGARGLTGELYRTSIFLSLQLSLGAVFVLAFVLARSLHAAALGVAILAFSRAFTEYSTSGLENALGHLLLALLAWIFFAGRRTPGWNLALGALAALAVVNRADAGLLVGPLVLVAALEDRRPRAWLALAAGFAPLVAWEAFCLLYYGFPLPNSALAKLNSGIPAAELAGRGLRYLGNSLRWDPVTLPATLAGALLPLALRDRRGCALGAGIALHLAYVVAVGGDFMSGRFLTPPLFAAVILVARAPLPERVAWPVAAALAAVILALPFHSPFRDRHYGEEPWAAVDAWGISDEWTYYRDSATLGRAGGEPAWPAPDVARHATWIRQTAWREDPHLERLERWGVLSPAERWPPGDEPESGEPLRPVVLHGAVGFYGFYLGADVHLLDYNGLGDPLLARLPMRRPDPAMQSMIPQMRDKEWRAGHFLRFVPVGYPETLATGENRIADPDLAAYYDKLSLVTRGPLLDPERLRTIWRLNTGAYDARLTRYLERQAERWRYRTREGEPSH